MINKKMNSNICKLCTIKNADKRNSHIIPKFLCKSLFDSTIYRNLKVIYDNGKVENKQDTPKENFIFCTNCEKRFEIIETYFASIIKDIHNYNALPNKFRHIIKDKIIECDNINAILFRLFVFSLIWRTSVSNLNEFEKFKIPNEIEEKLRQFLDSHLDITLQGLLSSVDSKEQTTEYHICLIKPNVKETPSGGVLSAVSTTEKCHILMLVDFALFFIVDDESLVPEMQVLSNKNKSKVIIGLGDNSEWRQMNRLFVNYPPTIDNSKLNNCH